jgi:hypothetical protein
MPVRAAWPLSSQCVEQCLGLLQIERIEPFSEPAIDRGEKIASLIPFALTAPPSGPKVRIASAKSLHT